MAGEWIKFDSSLPEKPETLAITAKMGWDDPDLTVGKLMRLFRWFDQHTTNGNAAGVTSSLLDRVLGVTGFTESVASVGWIVISAAGISLANFDRHNGATAKSRAQGAKRAANHRNNGSSNGNSNADSVTESLPREEKRREIPPNPLTGDGEVSPTTNADTPKVPTEPEGFIRFWQTWPRSERKGARGKCLETWKKAGAEKHVEVVLAHVERMKAGEMWTKEGGRYVPAPLVYLNKRYWEGADDADEFGDGSPQSKHGMYV
ncbi:hypothetical protein [Comamonas sp. 4034]|uniref:hypothetical protein n=1 Tax=Comamonas sp. 4034 TaxID=3156455 RepID=UPI003D24A064